MGTMDFIIDTVSAVHPLYPLLTLLKINGKLITVGLPNKPLELPIFPLVMGKLFELLFVRNIKYCGWSCLETMSCGPLLPCAPS